MTVTELITTYDNYKAIVDSLETAMININDLGNPRKTFKKWDASIDYLANDIISYNLDMYRALIDNINVVPTDIVTWEKVNV